MRGVKPISTAAARRAEQADANGGRCLVENCPRERAVEMAYIYDRENYRDTTTVSLFAVHALFPRFTFGR